MGSLPAAVTPSLGRQSSVLAKRRRAAYPAAGHRSRPDRREARRSLLQPEVYAQEAQSRKSSSRRALLLLFPAFPAGGGRGERAGVPLISTGARADVGAEQRALLSMARDESESWETLTGGWFNSCLSDGFLLLSSRDTGSGVMPGGRLRLTKIQQRRPTSPVTQRRFTHEGT